MKSNGRSISVGSRNLIIYSDASLTGLRETLNRTSVIVPWTEKDRDRHINELELLAALFALKLFTARASNVAILLMLDKRMAEAYVNKSGENSSENFVLSREVS